MLTPSAFEVWASKIATLNGLPIEQARRYMARIGDKPEIDAQGKAVVRDKTGAELARVVFPQS